MDTATPLAAFADASPAELLDLLTTEFVASLELLMTFQLGESLSEDTVANDLPRMDAVPHVAIRFGVRSSDGPRLAFVLLPLPGSLVLAGSLLMVPTDALRRAAERGSPDEGEKDALMEIGHLVGAAFDSLLNSRCGGTVDVRFAGCQGVDVGEAPWVPGYEGEAYAVRKQQVAFADLESFDITVAIPV